MLIMAAVVSSTAALPLKGHMVANMQEQIPSDDCCCSAAFYGVPLGSLFLASVYIASSRFHEASQALAPSTPTTPRGAARRAVPRKNPRSPRLGLVLSLCTTRIQIPGGAAAQDAAAATLLPLLSPLLSRHPCSSVCLPSPAWTPGSSQGLRAVAPPRRSTARGQTNAARAA